MKKTDFDILNISQIEGHNTLEIFKDGCTAKETDLVTLLGGNNSYNVYNGDSPYNVVSSNNHIFHYCRGEYLIGIRPIIPFRKIVDGIHNRHINEDGILEVEYGYYPQNIVKSDQAEKWQWLQHNLHATHTGNIYNPNDNNSFSEHEIDGIRYIVFYTGLTKRKTFHSKLSDGSPVNPEKSYFIQVEPIKWLVDKKSGLAISKYILSYEKIYNTSSFLKSFDNEIMQIKSNKSNIMNEENKIYQITNKKSDEISKIITEITKYAKYYHGKIDIDAKVTQLITEYNNKVNNILTGKNNILTLENNDKDITYLLLLANLNQILDSLKLNYENNKVYHDILELIDNCLLVIDRKKIEPQNELERDLMTTTRIIAIYLNNNHLNELKNIFNVQKEAITTSLENMENLSSKINGKYKSNHDFELAIRNELQTFLLSIYKEIIDHNIANEILTSYKNIASNNYKESRCSVIKVYLATLNEIAEYIKANGNKEDIAKLNNILSDINAHDNLNNVIKDLITVIKKLYTIQLNIEERINTNKILAEYTISIPKVKAKIS